MSLAGSAPAGSFRLCKILDVDIYVNFWLVAFFVYRILQASGSWYRPAWWSVSYAFFTELILFLTVLVHEFGHGLMTRKIGGSIDKVLLWPLGGICYSIMPYSGSSREKVLNDFKVVVAGPATHWIQGPFWAALMKASFPSVDVWQFFNPFISHSFPNNVAKSAVGELVCYILASAISINAALFIFNAFLPMYPLDASKILTSTLQLRFNFSPERTADWLIVISGLSATGFLVHGIITASRQGGAGNSITLLIGAMSLAETFQLKNLRDTGRLASHPLFSHAGSNDGSLGSRHSPASGRSSRGNLIFNESGRPLVDGADVSGRV